MSEKKRHRVIIGIELFLLCMIIVTLSINAASSNPPSNGVSYNKNNQTTVQNALDDLYTKANYGNATASQILKGRTALVGGKQVTGTLTIPTLASQTPGDATKENIDKGKIAWVNGEKIVGQRTVYSAISNALQIGDYVNYLPNTQSYTIPMSETGYTKEQTIYPSELNLWRVIRKNDDGTVELVSQYVSSTILIMGREDAYESTNATYAANFVSLLNKVASQYENSAYTISSRHMGYNPSIEDSYVGEEGCIFKYGYYPDVELVRNAIGTIQARTVHLKFVSGYWLASISCSNCIVNNKKISLLGGFDVDDRENVTASLFTGRFASEYNAGHPCINRDDANGELCFHFGNRVRPIIVLKSTLKAVDGNGTEESPWIIAP